MDIKPETMSGFSVEILTNALPRFWRLRWCVERGMARRAKLCTPILDLREVHPA